MPQEGNIIIRGARVNNLKDISLEIPRGKFVVITGISGSGKSSLAFDTLFAEGQRRFAQSLSSYARQFLGRMTKPDVTVLDGIPPAVAIEQRVNTRNPRSTVATTTDIYDYLRLIYARIGRTYSPISGVEVKCHTTSDVLSYIYEGTGDAVYILADAKWDSREDKVEYLLSLKGMGYSRMWGEGSVYLIDDLLKGSSLSGDWPRGLCLLVDRARLHTTEDPSELRTRLHSSVDTAFSLGDGLVSVVKDGHREDFSSRFEADGMTFRHLDEYMLSFNSPLGACPVCGGLGKIMGISEDLVIPDKSKSIYEGAIACWRGEKMGWFKNNVIRLASKYDIPVLVPYAQLPQRVKDLLWEGNEDDPKVAEEDRIYGINGFFKWVESNRYKIQYKYMLSRFSGKTTCHECHGSRIRKDALYVKVGGKNIQELMDMTVEESLPFLRGLPLTDYEHKIADKALGEIISRLEYLDEVGLSYLTLSRSCNTLSGGESQRISLVKALGSSLVGSMYILDEPSIGLHQRDTERLIGVLRKLRDIGNTVIVVEHDEEIIRAADILIDMGPEAGVGGGEVVYMGPYRDNLPKKIMDRSYTLRFLSGQMERTAIRPRRTPSKSIRVMGAMEHNLRDINVTFPLGCLCVVTGVSGSGKSTLVGDILYPALRQRLEQPTDAPGTFRSLEGDLSAIQRVEYVDQNSIGSSTRSNAVTYLKIYDDIRALMAEQQYAKINGYTSQYFSFNQDGGRCPECQGDGRIKVGMQFMADIEMVCEECGGKRFKPDILEVRYRGKNIDDILNMSVGEAYEFFSEGPEPLSKEIADGMKPLLDVGLSYIKLGQSSSTLSGGESQRIKLAKFLSMTRSGKNDKGHILFLFDEPTTGLHFKDVQILLRALDALIENGHSVIVVEHNLDVVREADWVIDLGPDAGDKGGEVVFAGTPEEMVKSSDTYTARYLRLSASLLSAKSQ